MKKCYFKYIFFIKILCYPIFIFSQNLPPDDIPKKDLFGRKTVLLSHPWSGSIWTAYSLGILTNRLCLQHGVNYNLDYDKNKVFIHKTHNLSGDIYSKKQPDYYSSERDYLILIVRNYKEILFRQAKSFESLLFHMENSKKKPWFQWYLQPLKDFDHWDSSRKILIYYEDLLQNPKKIFKELLSFLNEGDTFLDEFLLHINEHKNACLNIRKNHGWEKIYSQGNDIFFHSKKFTKQQREKIDQLMELLFPYYFKKYLLRYVEK